MYRLKASIYLLVLAVFSTAVLANESQIKKNLKIVNPQVKVVSVKQLGQSPLYAVEMESGELIYTDKTARYILLGELLEYSAQTGMINHSQLYKKTQRYNAINKIKNQDKVIFYAKGKYKNKPKTIIHVFTDIDCSFCRKLHKEVPELTAKGVQINYLAFPRAGIGSPTYNKMQSIWCAPVNQRQQLMSKAKKNISIKKRTCDNQVAAQFELGRKLGVTGTPALVLADGSLKQGYLSAKDLLQGLGLQD